MWKKLAPVAAVAVTALLVGIGLIWAERPGWLPSPESGVPAGIAPSVDAPPPLGLGARPGPVARTESEFVRLRPGDRSLRSRLPRAQGAAGRADLEAPIDDAELRSRLLDPDERVRLEALEDLDERENQADLDLLRQLAIFDPSSRIRVAAVRALAALEANDVLGEVAEAALGDPEADPDNIEALLDLEALSAGQLVPFFGDELHYEQAIELFENLGDLHSGAISTLFNLAYNVESHQNFDMAARAAEALSYLNIDGGDEAVDFVDFKDDQLNGAYFRERMRLVEEIKKTLPGCQTGSTADCNRAIEKLKIES